MDSDVSPALLEAIQTAFDAGYSDDELIAGLLEKAQAGTATYEEANLFAESVGELLADCYKQCLSSEVLPDGKMYYNIAKKVAEPTLTNNYELVSDYAETVQTKLNENAEIGIKAQKAELNQDRIDGIINKISSAEQYDDVAWVLDEPVKTFTQSIVDDTIKKNAEFQYKSGLNPTIKRKLAGGCCEWCAEVAGTYSYPDVPKDVYRRHQRCRCTVEYDPKDGKKKIQNVHTKEWRNVEEGGIIENNKEIRNDDLHHVSTGGKRNEKSLTEEQYEKAKESARRQGYTGSINYSDNSNTGYIGFGLAGDLLVIGTDAYPIEEGKTPNELISLDGCMAHEVIGHYEARIKGTTQESNVLEEAQASLRASKFGVGLTKDERDILYQDAMERLKQGDFTFDEVKEDLDIWER